MAEVVILSAVAKIGVALGNEAMNQATLQFNNFITQLTELQGSMGRIRRELRLMHEYLCRMDIRNRNNQTYEIWVEEVRMFVHGIEDIVDEYLHLVGQKHDSGWSACLKKGFKQPNVFFSLNRIASLVKEAEVNLVHLFQAKDRWVSMVDSGYMNDSSYIVERSQHLASTSRSLAEEDLVEVDGNRKKLEQWLAGDELERSVIVLHGMGGLGKTTLAANVYRKESENFDCHCWVSVSQTYSREDVLKKLIKELFKDKAIVPSNIETMDIISLEEALKNFLEQRKYLIMLDDVWTPEAFHDLSGVVIRNKKGSRVVITTREGNVAGLASQGQVLTLKPLSKDGSWELFCKTVFPIDTKCECPTELTELAHEVVDKCKGIPLAIVSIGKLLFVRDKTKEELKRIHDQLDWELINNPSLEHVRNILYLSYLYLPTYLKSCFLYCSLFPEDYLFKRKKLIRLWVAEGFVMGRGESTMEEVAEGYLEELVHRNMLQVDTRNPFGRIKSFRMHDIVRELAVDLCRRECFGVVYEEDKYMESLDESDARRLVIHKMSKDIYQSVSGVHRLRSVIALDINIPSSTLLPLIAKRSRYISVLELSGLPIEKVPDGIGDLFNLRYLGLRGSKVKLLPRSIEKLSSLLTLDLSGSGMKELPRGIGELKKLRQLFTDKASDRFRRDFRCGGGVCIPKGLENLTSLQTLVSLEAQDESVRQLGELRQLRSLEIWNVKGTYCGHICAALAEMRHLSYLHVNASQDNEVLRLSGLPPNLQRLSLTGRLAEGTLGESPLFLTSGRNLYSLSLSWSQMIEDPLPSLSRLSNLMDLMLTRACSGKQMTFLAGWFPKLKTLRLRDLPNLEVLEMKEGAVVSLEILTLVNLEGMVEVPPGIEFLAHVKYISFREITSEFLTSLRQCPRTQGVHWRHTLR
ncbi:hypothetical protein CFC21_061345 [Triticum aestivum]|uniref:Disease resistance protein RPM1 n=4 Tax=Triticinae TaxID=1648030 RepID=A0A453HT10_AEGTS|nr:disease resistance protein RPM1 [Aegilops tauschii subsp. strangulata]XP_044374475.1 disease resistance protein RPM1-like [Triticum aestivum]XP_044374476.1 disease resistance protein RPM1-like [Triticum aestivum]XP_044374477.1 disease resistance protein RPM1-like [Triticum aestivum]XP_044374478.1 disease resistance protein RPM1-like [Triticum aestivum]XP_045083478.1 disease resistance protein RPM1 [Aegilops tauschii subsp. strangulata]KAF7053417.1 hypothetical protein CFC21_061345 [Triticu